MKSLLGKSLANIFTSKHLIINISLEKKKAGVLSFLDTNILGKKGKFYFLLIFTDKRPSLVEVQ